MMFADLIDQDDFVEALQELGQAIESHGSVAEVLGQVDVQNPEVLNYLHSLLDPALNVHPEILEQVSSVINNLS